MTHANFLKEARVKRPSVLHLTTSLHFGGVERHMEVIARTPSPSRFRHSFVALNGGGAVETALRELGAETTCLEKSTTIPSPTAIIALIMLLLQKRPLVLHCHGAEANFHGLISAWLTRVPVRIGEEIGIPSHSRKAKWVFRHVYRFAHRVVGVSEAVVSWLTANGEVPKRKVVKIYNPVLSPDPHQVIERPHDAFRVCFVGRLEPVKNPMSLLEGFAVFSVGEPSAELWFVGEGSERGALETAIAKGGLERRVKLLGFQRDPVAFIRQCHVCVQPSISEGFGLSLVEAMRSDVPVIASAVGGAPEFIQHGVTGWLLSEGSPPAIARALQEAADLAPDELAAVGVRARESVKGRFEPAQYLSAVEDLYERVLSLKSRATTSA